MSLTKFEKISTNGFRWYGELVGKYPFWFFIIPVLFTLAMLAPLFLIVTDQDIIMLFTPQKAPSRREQETFRQFSRMEAVSTDRKDLQQLLRASDSTQAKMTKDRLFWWFNVQIVFQNESNLMTYEAWKAMHEVISYTYDNFTCHVKGGRTFKYVPDFCNPKTGCVRMDDYFSSIMECLPGGRFANKSDIVLTYPMISIHGEQRNWGELVFGAKVDNRTRLLESAKDVFVFLEFQFESNATMVPMVIDCMHQLQNYFYSKTGYRGLQFFPLHENMLKDELLKTKSYTLPYLTLTILFVSCFSMFSSLEKYNVILSAAGALLGVCTIGLALIGSFGFMYLCGVYFNVMVSITPFITMCVGIDNDFLLLAAWRHTDRNAPSHKRLGKAFAEACPSLTITSVTDVLCFTIGILIDTPAVSKFCLFTAVTLGLRFIYQVTFFAAIMSYGGSLEKNGDKYDKYALKKLRRILRHVYKKHSFSGGLPENTSTSTFPAPPMYTEKPLKGSESTAQLVSVMYENGVGHGHQKRYDGSRDPQKNLHKVQKQPLPQRDHWAHKFFRERWAEILSKKIVKIFAICLFIIYFSVAIHFACKIIVYIKPEKLIVDDSKLLPALKLAEKYVVSYSVIGHAFVLNPPDFRNESSRIEMVQFLNALESTRWSTGSLTTNVWFRDYVGYLEFLYSGYEGYQENFYKDLPDFLTTDKYSKYYSDFRFKSNLNETQHDDGEPDLEKFKFRVYFENATTWEDRVALMVEWRRICAKFPRLNALVFDHTNLNPYYDQWLTLAATNLETTGIAVICMALVTASLMPDLRSVFFITVSFISVDIGVIGWLRILHADLDPITVACILMTIGFSIYYTARVCYCYQCADKRLEPCQKLALTMGAVGWPVLQGGISTFLGVLPLLLVKSYMVRLFFKTITLVVIAGLLHGLIFMPVIMSCLDNSAKSIKRRVNLKRLEKLINDQSRTSNNSIAEFNRHTHSPEKIC